MNASAPFEYPFTYWVGMDVHTGDPEQLQAFHDYYTGTHLPEVLAANPGFALGHRYALETPDPRGVPAPAFLAAYELTGEEAAQTYLGRNDGPAEGRPRYTPGPRVWQEHMELRWRMIWKQFAAVGPVMSDPRSVFVVGMDPPATAGPAELEEFNDFYTNRHVPEVLESLGYQRATRYELVRGLLHPEPGCPRYVAVYEADEVTSERLAGGRSPGGSGAPMTPGPAVWEGRRTQWRLVYRRLVG